MTIPLVASAGDWPTFGHDPQRSGWATDEDILSPSNAGSLELVWKKRLDNQADSLNALTAPIVANGVHFTDGIRSIVYVAGSSDHVFALDAKTGELVWTRTFNASVVPRYPSFWACPDALNATPVISDSRKEIYAVASDGRLYGLDLATGSIKYGPVQFVPPLAKDWSLNLIQGIIYTTVSQGCGGAQSGIYSADVRNPLQPVIRNVFTGASGRAGIWGRGGAVIGGDGKIYVTTGDGLTDPAAGKLGSSVVAASLPDLKILDYFTPKNSQVLTKEDLDVSSASPVWFHFKNYNLLAAGGKEGVIYLLNAESLGGGTTTSPLFATPRLGNDEGTFRGAGIWGSISTWKGHTGRAWLDVPIWGPVSKDAPRFPIVNGHTLHGSVMAFKLGLNPVSKGPILEPGWITGDFNVPEPVAIENGVVFVLSTGEHQLQTNQGKYTVVVNSQRAHLYALDGVTGKVLYRSGDAIDSWVHFSGLAIAGGHIYVVDHSPTVYCFGLKGR
ncbi:MAG: PQQ-binding-like beta-propeller repeat protein [Terriglobia bacterium]